MGWVVWGQSYLNRNASVALVIGVTGGAGWRTLRIAESYDKEWYGAGDRDM